MTWKNTFFEGWSWFKFHNLGLALTIALKFYTSVTIGSKLKVRKFWGLYPTFVEVIEKKLVGGLFDPLFWIGLSFKHNFLKKTFSPSAIIEWNKLDPSLRKSASYNAFENSILKFIIPFPNKVFQCHNPKRIKLPTRLRLGLSHLWEHKFKSSFKDTLNLICSYGLAKETASLIIFFSVPCFTLMNNIREIDSTILNKSESVVTCILLYGDKFFKDNVNLVILNVTIGFIFSTNIFDEPVYLFWIHECFSFLFMIIWLQFYNF